VETKTPDPLFKSGLIWLHINSQSTRWPEHSMDLVLHLADEYVLDAVWTRLAPWPRDYVPRQILSLSVVTLVGIHLLYFIFAGLSYKFIFNHDMMRHPRFLKNQIQLEITTSLEAFPFMTLLTLPWFQAEVMGCSRLYDRVDKYGWTYLVLSVPWWVAGGTRRAGVIR